VFVAMTSIPAPAQAGPASPEKVACQAIFDLPNLTLLEARLMTAEDGTPDYCYVQGLITPGIHYHVQLPLPQNWNGRLLNLGDGAKDGDLDFADHRVVQGYTVANSNMGHDAGAEPGVTYSQIRKAGFDAMKKAGMPEEAIIVNPHSVGLQHTDQPYRDDVPFPVAPDLELKPGMTITVDLPYIEVGWGAGHNEDLILITETGYQALNSEAEPLVVT